MNNIFLHNELDFSKLASPNIIWCLQSIVDIAQMSIMVEKLQIYFPRGISRVLLSGMFMQTVAVCKDVSEQMFLQGPG